jgi:hypothetical protein
MGGGIVGTVTAGERVNSTGPHVVGLFFVAGPGAPWRDFARAITQLAFGQDCGTRIHGTFRLFFLWLKSEAITL